MQQNYRDLEPDWLPEEWEISELGDIAKVSSGGSAPQGTQYFNGEFPFVRVQHIDNQDHVIRSYDLITEEAVKDYKLKLYPKGTILFPKSGASVYLEKRAILPTNAYLVSHLCAVNASKENVLQDFLFYLLCRMKLAKEKADGYPTLNLAEVKRIKIPLPPRQEQKKIAYVLSTVQEAREKTEAVIAALKELKKSLMKHLFTYGPVSLEEAEKVRMKETEIGEIPEEWEVEPLIHIATLQRGKDLPKQNQISGPYPIVGSSGIIGYHNEYVCEGPGVVTGRSGSIGNITYVDRDYWPHNTGLYVKDFHGNNPKFIYYLFNLLDFKKYATGVSVPTLNRNFIHTALLPLPPISAQQKINENLSAADEKIEKEENKKRALGELFNSLLNDFMTAKIRVKDLELPVVADA